jgi:hypothetical protein
MPLTQIELVCTSFYLLFEPLYLMLSAFSLMVLT